MCILTRYVMCIYCYQTWLKPSSDIQPMTSKATTSYRLIYQYMIVHLMSMQYSTYICLANYFDNSHSPEKLLKHLVMFVLPTDWYFLHHGHIDILGCYPYYPFFGGYTYRFIFQTVFRTCTEPLEPLCLFDVPSFDTLWYFAPGFFQDPFGKCFHFDKTLNTNTSLGHVSSLFTATTTLEMPRARILAHEIFRDEKLCVVTKFEDTSMLNVYSCWWKESCTS